MAELGLAANAALFLGGIAAMLALVWFVLPYHGSRPCPGCGARQPFRAQACGMCGAALPGPPDAHPGAPPYGFRSPEGEAPKGPRVEGGEAFNRGITRRVVSIATLAMGLGIGVRLAGMLGVLGLPQLPVMLDGLLTVAGGVIAFVGFVFLDAA